MNDFSRKTLVALARRGITLIGSQAIPDMASGVPFANASHGYLINDNGRGCCWTFAQVMEATRPLDPRDPDCSRPGIFAHHNCSRCKNGAELSRCPTPDRPGNCGCPNARND